MVKEIFVCPEGSAGRVDKILANAFPDKSRSLIQRAIERKMVCRKNGTHLNAKSKVIEGEELIVDLSHEEKIPLCGVNIPLNILFEDSEILVIDKPSGMVVHPGDGTKNDTLIHALMYHRANQLCAIGAPERPGIVHRLDKETSGVMVVAKSESAHLSLLDQFASRKTAKIYQAIVCRKLEGRGEYKQPIGRHPTVRVKMAVCEKGKPALTKWKSLKVMSDQFTYIECEIMTGRTHQIRVHLSSAGHPLAGDKTYGYKANKSDEPISRVMLHACKLSFEHPETSRKLEFSAPLPADFQQCLKRLE